MEGIPHVGRRATEHYRTDDAGKIVKTLLSRKPNYSISESVARSFPYKSQAVAGFGCRAFCGGRLPAYAESEIALSGTAALLTQYVDRGITNSAEKPAVQSEFDLTYKELFYAGIWVSNVDFGATPNGRSLATLEVDYYVGATPKFGKWNFDIAAYYVAYPGAFDPGGNFNYFELWTGVSRSLFDDKLEVKLYNYWSPNYFGETGNNDVLEISYSWTFGKVGHVMPKLAGNLGHQWGTLSQGGYDYAYWSVAMTFGFNNNPAFEFEIRYWDSFDFRGFTCPPSGVL